MPATGKYNSRTPRPDASGKVHVYDIMVTITKTIELTTTVVSRFLDNTMIVTDVSNIYAATITADITNTACTLAQQSASYKGTTWVGYANTVEVTSGVSV